MACSLPPRPCGWAAQLLIFLCFFGLLTVPVFASNPASLAEDALSLPAEYGRVIYQKNSGAEDQIYIIGQAHRSGVSGINGENTVQTQLEIFRIGEWLVKKRNVGLLLPEGFFCKNSSGQAAVTVIASQRTDAPSPDDESLRERLLETNTFVNADTLLKTNYNLCLGQVEDEKLYREVAVFLRRLGDARGAVDPALYDQLDLFQKQRTAVMLQNIPTVTESVFQQGAIQSKRAIFTIGMAHVPEIVEFLQRGEVESVGGSQNGSASLALLEREFGVTVILPKTLAEDERVLRSTRMYDLATE